jgi:hypothetical protein
MREVRVKDIWPLLNYSLELLQISFESNNVWLALLNIFVSAENHGIINFSCDLASSYNQKALYHSPCYLLIGARGASSGFAVQLASATHLQESVKSTASPPQLIHSA